MTPPLTIALLLGALAFADPPTPDAPDAVPEPATEDETTEEQPS